MKVYSGQEPFSDFLRLQAQGTLFCNAVERDSNAVKRKLDAIAVRVVNDLGSAAPWTDLKETLKSRAAGKVAYDSALAVASLEIALRTRGKAIV